MNLMDELGITQAMIDGAFGEKAPAKAANPLAHPHAEKIIEQAIDFLDKIPSGQRLIDIKERYNVPINVLRGKEITYNLPDEETIFLVVPIKKNNPVEVVALALACGIREAEQRIVGFSRPSKHLPPEEYSSILYSKSLDIILCMCKIADEVHQKLGFTSVLDIIEELGHGEVYRAYKANKGFEALGSVFIESEKKANA